jgi:hypothetical protein
LIKGGQSGVTTRYWDCCKPSCAWNAPNAPGNLTCDINNNPDHNKNDQSGCSGGGAYSCWDLSPWSVSCQLSYGFAATSTSNLTCGRCYQLDFHGQGLDGKSMIVQAINDGGDVQGNQFDILIPGGGVGAFNGCSTQWHNSNLGQQYGGFLATCGSGGASCVENMCQQVFGSDAQLMAGCSWFTGWFNTANNPTITYQQVSCPSDLTARSGIPGQ